MERLPREVSKQLSEKAFILDAAHQKNTKNNSTKAKATAWSFEKFIHLESPRRLPNSLRHFDNGAGSLKLLQYPILRCLFAGVSKFRNDSFGQLYRLFILCWYHFELSNCCFAPQDRPRAERAEANRQILYHVRKVLCWPNRCVAFRPTLFYICI